MDDEEHATITRIADNCKLLYSGYPERVEYTVDAPYHREHCPFHGKIYMTGCDCPKIREKRTRSVQRPGYLAQLKEFSAHKDTDRNPKAERGAPRVKVAGRPPGDMAGFFTLDELMCDIPSVVDKALEEAGRDRTWAATSVPTILAGLATQTGLFIEARPDVARVIDKAAARWVAVARGALKVGASDGMFEGAVCGNCGGALATPWGNRGESAVSCAGSPSEPPCGQTYPMSEWIKLYEGRTA